MLTDCKCPAHVTRAAVWQSWHLPQSPLLSLPWLCHFNAPMKSPPAFSCVPHPDIQYIKAHAHGASLCLDPPPAWRVCSLGAPCHIAPFSLCSDSLSGTWVYNKYCFSWASLLFPVVATPDYLMKEHGTHRSQAISKPLVALHYTLWGSHLHPRISYPSFFAARVFSWVVSTVCFLPLQFWGADSFLTFRTLFVQTCNVSAGIKFSRTNQGYDLPVTHVRRGAYRALR